MTPAVLWVLLVFVYLPTPHWGVASIEFPYSDTSGNRAPMVSTFTSRNECLAGLKEAKEELAGMVLTDHQDSRAVFGVGRNKVVDVNPENGNATMRPNIWRHEPKCVRAALLLATGTAHANDLLPESVLGRWCHDGKISNESKEVYFRPGGCCCNDMTDGITIDQEGYSDDSPVDNPGDCLFDKIERRGRDTYLIHTRCKRLAGRRSLARYWEQRWDQREDTYFPSAAEFQIIKGLLFVTWVPEG
jgi:hypothetical protein